MRHAATFLTCASCAIAVLSAQFPTEQRAVFRSGTDLVTIDVTVHDRRGRAVKDLTVDGRLGYVAPTPASTAAPPLGTALRARLGAAVPTSDLRLQASAVPISRRRGETVVAMTLAVSHDSTVAGATFTDDIRYGMVAADADGRLLAASFHQLELQTGVNDVGRVLYQVSDLIEVPDAAATLRLGVESRGLGRVGTVHLPFAPPRSRNGRWLGGILLRVDGRDHGLDAMSRAFAAAMPWPPTALRGFERWDRLVVYAPVLSSDASEAEVVGRFAILREGETVHATEPAAARRAIGPGGSPVRALEATIPLTQFSPGQYRIEVSIDLPDAETLRSHLEFEIVQGDS
jgi:hypothetical protein